MDAEHAETTEESAPTNIVLRAPLFKRKSTKVTFATTPPPPKPDPVRRPAKVAQQLALAHHLQWAIDRGELTDRAALSRILGFTRARITQLMELLLLAPDTQEEVLAMEAVDGAEPMSERALRQVCSQRLHRPP